nr:hypothetical protein [Tanacetum cinerariifolium]
MKKLQRHKFKLMLLLLLLLRKMLLKMFLMMVKKLEKANKIKSSKLRRLRKVGTSRRVESSDDMEDVFNHGRMIADMDMNEGIELVKDAEVAESEGRNAAKHAEKQAEIYNLDLDHSSKVLKVVTAAASQVSAASTTIPAASATIPAAKPTIPAVVPIVGKGILVETSKPLKKKDQIEMDAEYAKKLKLSEEAQEAEDLRKRLEVVEDKDDDVFVEATPLASKVPVVDYQIVLID